MSTTSVFGLVLDLTGIDVPPNLQARIAAKLDETQGVLTEYTAPHPLELSMLRHYQAPDLTVFRRTMDAIERGPFRLVEASDGSVALYDVRDDPAELADVAPRRPERVAELRALLRARDENQGTALPAGTAKFDENARNRLRALGYIE